MNVERHAPPTWRTRTVEIKVWKIVAVLLALPVLVFWFNVVHQEDEILALVRNEVVTTEGQRNWVGSFVNTNDRALRDVVVAVDLLDAQNRPVGRVEGKATELTYGSRLELQAPLPSDVVRLRIYSVQWRMGDTAALMGPFRKPWEFGYLMVDG